MGIPKFFRFLSERYPNLFHEVGPDAKIPEFDCFYLDMNGIIHTAARPRDDAICRLTETEQILNIFRYIERIFNVIKPKKVFFMAVDGCAPRAKMNQQRQRRFRAAKELSENLVAARARGEDVPEQPFDSNCITPGTEFMAKLSQHLHFFVQRKMQEDSSWRVPQIILSGHDVPGEGEHKIMEFIRNSKMQPGYEPNRRHCLLGNDADLIMLSLVSHEPHFALLREKIDFRPPKHREPSKVDKAEAAASKTFELLHVTTLRDYLLLEFQDLQKQISFPFDLERIIDDWVLMAYFVGNDFLPHLPLLDIATGALRDMYDIYKRLLPTFDGYMTNNGDIDVKKLEAFLRELGEVERNNFLRAETEEVSHRGKRGGGRRHRNEEFEHSDEEGEGYVFDDLGLDVASGEHGPSPSESSAGSSSTPSELASTHEAIKAARERALGGGGDDSAQQGPTPAVTILQHEKPEGYVDEESWKIAYYRTKFEWSYRENADQLRILRHKYVEGILWCYHYYYHGVASWGWFFPYHYAPLASDLVGLETYEFHFELGTPFRPFEQLLGVLPIASEKLLPESYARLMSAEASPIKSFYPITFEVDMNGKKNAWEGIALIPFIDEKLLRAAVSSVSDGSLTADERRRNQFGHPWVFNFDEKVETHVVSTLPSVLPDITQCHITEATFAIPELPLGTRFSPTLCPGVRLGKEAPAGFPGLFSLAGEQVTGTLRHIGINLFGMASKKESMVLTLPPAATPTAEALAPVLGKRLFWGWPYLREGIVSGLCDGRVQLRAAGNVKTPLTGDTQDKWRKDANMITSSALSHRGLDIGEVSVTVHIRPFVGMVRSPTGALVKQFSDDEQVVPWQLCAPRDTSEDLRFVEKPPPPVENEFPVGCEILFTGPKYYGARGTVLSHKGEQISVSLRFRPTLDPFAEFFGRRIVQDKLQWFKSSDVCRYIRCNPLVLSKLMGSVRILPENDDIGLGIKFDKRGLALAGFARRNDEDRWEYSQTAIDCLRAYAEKYPEVFRLLTSDSNNYTYEAISIWPPKGDGSRYTSGPLNLSSSSGADGDKKEGDHRHHSNKKNEDSVTRDDAALKLAIADASAKAKEVAKWIKTLPCGRSPYVAAGSEALSPDVIELIEKQADAFLVKQNAAVVVPTTVWAERAQLMRPSFLDNAAPVRNTDWNLGDRVMYARDSGAIPFCQKGTVVGVGVELADIVFDEKFMTGENLAGRCSEMRGATSDLRFLLNITRNFPAFQQQYQQQQQQQRRPQTAGGYGGGGGAAGGGGSSWGGGRGGGGGGDNRIVYSHPQPHNRFQQPPPGVIPQQQQQQHQFAGRGGGGRGRGGGPAGAIPFAKGPGSSGSSSPADYGGSGGAGQKKIFQRPGSAPAARVAAPVAAVPVAAAAVAAAPTKPTDPQDILKALGSMGISVGAPKPAAVVPAGAAVLPIPVPVPVVAAAGVVPPAQSNTDVLQALTAMGARVHVGGQPVAAGPVPAPGFVPVATAPVGWVGAPGAAAPPPAHLAAPPPTGFSGLPPIANTVMGTAHLPDINGFASHFISPEHRIMAEAAHHQRQAQHQQQQQQQQQQPGTPDVAAQPVPQQQQQYRGGYQGGRGGGRGGAAGAGVGSTGTHHGRGGGQAATRGGAVHHQHQYPPRGGGRGGRGGHSA